MILFLFIVILLIIFYLNKPATSEHFEADNEYEFENCHTFPNCNSYLNNHYSRCTRNRVRDIYNAHDIRGGQGMYVNFDTEMLYDPKKLIEKWVPTNESGKAISLTESDFQEFNSPSYELDKHKIEFDFDIAQNNNIYRSFEIPCNKNKKKKKKNSDDIVLNGVDYITAEKFYERNYNSDRKQMYPKHFDEFWLPYNYSDFTKFKYKDKDKVLPNRTVYPNEIYKTRVYEKIFGI
jgi:hypothetical protein